MNALFTEIRNCQICAGHLPNPPKPVLRGSKTSKIMIIGQAPGQKVQHSGIPWDDQSGKELRRWLGVTPEQFYDESVFAIMPMGFCFPGTGKSGDLPPRPECAPQWHGKIWDELQDIQLTLLIGQYAQGFYLDQKPRMNVTETVRRFEDYLPRYLPLVHPSPRNKIWHKKNPWFEIEIVPVLQGIVQAVLAGNSITTE